MSDRRWQDEDIPPALRRVLASAAADEQRAERQQARLQARLIGLGIPVASAPVIAGSNVVQAHTSGAAAAGAGATGSSAAAGSVVAASKAWLGLLVVAAVGGGGALYAALQREQGPERGLDSAQVMPRQRTANSAQSQPAAHGALEKRRAEPAATTQPAPRRGNPARPAAPTGRAPGEPTRPARSDVAGLREEVRLIDAIRAVLVESPDDGLRYAEQHARAFPHGVLAPERELLRIEALLLAERVAAARALGSRLIEENPDSAYARRIQSLLAAANAREAAPLDPGGDRHERR